MFYKVVKTLQNITKTLCASWAVLAPTLLWEHLASLYWQKYRRNKTTFYWGNSYLCVFVTLGPEGLLWSTHVWTSVKPWQVHPHQLDRPRWQRFLFLLQRLRSNAVSDRRRRAETEGQKRWGAFSSSRRFVRCYFSKTKHQYLKTPSFNQTYCILRFLKGVQMYY